MLTAKNIAVGLVTQATAIRRKEEPKGSQRCPAEAKHLLDTAALLMATKLTGVRQK